LIVCRSCFAIDPRLAISDGFRYALNCEPRRQEQCLGVAQMIGTSESERIKGLLREFELSAAEDVILERCHPMIMIGLEDLSAREHRQALSAMPIGASRWGAYPDVPADFVWPRLENAGPMHFLMQLNLASVPIFDGSPLPAHGLLYVFAGMGEHDYRIDVQLLYSSADEKHLRRLAAAPELSPDDLFLEYFPTTFEPFLVTASLGVDIQYRADHNDLIQLIEERIPKTDWEILLDRYHAVAERAADSRYEALQSSGYPIHWWRVAQLFGATNPTHQEEAANSYVERSDQPVTEPRWHRFVSLESNTITGFDSLCDARPYRVLVREPAQKPWTKSEHIQTCIEAG
jgi:hypothetical protein